MNLYRCFIEGENFPLKIEGIDGLVGFYTTRFVRAESPQQAELMALDLLRADPTLDVDPSRRNASTRVFFESIEEIDVVPDGVSSAGTGYTFFPMGT